MKGLCGVVAVAALIVAGCGGSGSGGSDSGGQAQSGGEGPKIALLLPETKTTRYEEQDKPSFIASVKQLCPDCQVIYNNADQDPARQQQQAEAAIADGAKVLVVDAVDVKSAASIAARAKQSNIPVVSYGRLIASPDVDYFVSIDPFRVGQQQAKVLLDALGGGSGKRIVMVNGSPTDSNAAPYKKGAEGVLKQAGAKVVKEFDTPDWSPDKAQTEMDQAITALGKGGFDAVYVANDGMAGGVIASMKGAGVDPAKRPVTGQDAELAAVQRILAGQQLMTVYQPIADIAKSSAELAVPLAQGKQPPAITTGKVNNGSKDVPAVLLDTIAIDKTNVQKVVDAGFVKTADLCTGSYATACKDANIH
jgi:D-xylose transport system substrate-binding protein